MISDEKFAVSQELMEQAYDYLKDGYEQALSALEKAEAENAKLRELACILAWCAVGADCDKCPINTLDFSEWPNGREICYSADDRMRELGVEAD